jgi:hypothetical protein
MARRVFQSLVAVVSLVLLVGLKLSGQPAGMPSTKNGDWTHYTADMRGTKYSPLDQINGSNFNQLEVAWRFKTDNPAPAPSSSSKAHRWRSRAFSPPAAPIGRGLGKPHRRADLDAQLRREPRRDRAASTVGRGVSC